MTDRDLTTIVETVCASEWERQKGQPWDDVPAMTKHHAREALLPFVRATLAAIDEVQS